MLALGVCVGQMGIRPGIKLHSGDVRGCWAAFLESV